MKSILIAAIAVSAAVVAVDSSAASKADEAIKQGFGRLDRCLADDDATCVGELFVEDGSFSEPASGAKVIRGKAQIVKTLKDLKGAKRTHSVESVRMIGADHALVDCSVAGMKAPGDAYHAVAIMVLQGDTWLFEDLRTYVVGSSNVAPAAPAKPADTATPPPAAK